MESNEIFRTTSPRKMTCELFGKKQRVHFKNNVRILQTKRAKQALKKSKIFSLVVGIIIPEETTRSSKSYASTQTTNISRPHSGTPTCVSFRICALTAARTVRPVDCDSWSWQRRKEPLLTSLFVGTSGTTTMDIASSPALDPSIQ